MRDVRMRGFAERADVEEVERFLENVTPALAAEPVPVAACAGRVLAEDVRASVDVPAFRRSATIPWRCDWSVRRCPGGPTPVRSGPARRCGS
jgi:hypothetical protein